MRQFDRSFVGGSILILLGVSLLLQNIFHLDEILGPAVLLIIGIALIGSWSRSKRQPQLIGGSVVSCLGIYVLVDQFSGLGKLEGPLFFLFQAAAFYIVHRLSDEKPRWALYTAIGLAGFSLFVLAVDGFGTASDLAAPVIFILIGVLLMTKR